MKRIRYLTALLVLLLVGSTSLWAQDDTFNPADPPEPEQPAMRLDLSVSPSEAGSAIGSGRYAPGTKVSVNAYANTGFRFVQWTNSNGETVSTEQNFTYTKQEGHEQLTANFVFDPDAPADPAEPKTIMYFKLVLKATEGGSVSGGGSYLADKEVTLRAYCDMGFDFDGWYDAEGNCLSTNTTFNYTTTAHHTMLTGRFAFNPSNPVEPTEPTIRPKHNVTATCTEGGSISWTFKRLQEGESVTLTAYTNDGYTFLGWFLNGELYTKLTQFSYTVSTEPTQDFEARWEFNPSDPSEPGMPTTTKHAFFLMNKVTKPGNMIKYPIYLSAVRPLGDMTFQLEFPEMLAPDFKTVEMSEKAVGYNISYTKEDATNYVFTLTGGSVPTGNSTLLVFTINVPEDVETAQNYPVKINQVSVTEADGSTLTASTRNGRISVYKNGDTNGDDVVNVVDVANTISNILDETPKDYITEAADTNDDTYINVVDVAGTIDIILDDDTPAQGYQQGPAQENEPD